jgi:hypothetical protein
MPYECHICDLEFPDSTVLYEHKGSAHRGEVSHECEMCGSLFGDRVRLVLHLQAHVPLVCKICDVEFLDADGLVLHHEVHGGEKCYLCDVCSSLFGDPDGLTQHAHIHTRVEAVAKRICSASQSALTPHEQRAVLLRRYKTTAATPVYPDIKSEDDDDSNDPTYKYNSFDASYYGNGMVRNSINTFNAAVSTSRNISDVSRSTNGNTCNAAR